MVGRGGFCSGAALTALAAATALAQGPAIAPKSLFDGDPACSASRLAPLKDGVAASTRDGGLDVTVPGGSAAWPGIALVPTQGDSWDLSPWGRVEAVVSNACDSPLHLTLRVDNPGDWRRKPWNAESVMLKPREAKTVRVVFGYEYGFKPCERPFDQSRVSQLLFFLGKSDGDRAFRVEAVQAAGAAGDPPPVDPSRRVAVPKDGVIIGGANEAKFSFFEGAGAARGGKDGVVTIAPGKRGAVKVGPAAGFLDLGAWTEVRVSIRNMGAAPLALALRLDSASDSAEPVTFEVAPGATSEARLPFAAARPWVGKFDEAAGKGGAMPGTGTKFASNRFKTLAVIAEAAPDERVFEIVGAKAAVGTPDLPDWLGKRPPISGDWVQTLAEEFDGDSVDESRWNVHASNFWDKRTHFSRENAIVSGGLVRLRYERKPGFHNDDPGNRSPVAHTDWACGILTSYGKWTQRYGYFEARMKLPSAPGLWPAFWTMPDRGPGTPGEGWSRGDTHNGGMEFDILEHLTGWGSHRFNVACHWDGYGKEHRAVGTSGIYFDTDAEGFVVVGLLWLPGHMSIWVNGREAARWESPRVCSVPSYLIFYMVSGGWDNAPFDPKALPDEFVVDWCRAWQRADIDPSVKVR